MRSRSLFWISSRIRRTGSGAVSLAAAAAVTAWLCTMVPVAGAAPAVAAPSAGKETKNPYEGKTEAIAQGEKIFDAKCSECHGGDAMGMSGPDLTDDKWVYGGSDADVFETVTNGRKGGMPSWKSDLNKDEIWKVIAYLRSLRKQ